MILQKFKKVCEFLTEMLFYKNFFERKKQGYGGKTFYLSVVLQSPSNRKLPLYSKKFPSKPPFKTFYVCSGAATCSQTLSNHCQVNPFGLPRKRSGDQVKLK